MARDQQLTDEIADRLYGQYHEIIADVNNAWEELRKEERDETHVLAKEAANKNIPPD